MPQTGLGVALKTLRERRTLSLREIGQLSSVDHAYVHRLETGEKTNPSQDLVEKLLKVLKSGERDAALVMWLVDHADADPSLVEFVLQDPSISIDIFSAAAGVRHRGNRARLGIKSRRGAIMVLCEATSERNRLRYVCR